MATPDLLLGYSSLPQDAVTTSVANENSDYPHENSIFGGASTRYSRNVASTFSNVTYDLGSGVTGTAEYIALRKADLLTDLATGEIDVKLRASTDNFSASNDVILSADDIEVSDLVGPRSDNILVVDTESSAYRYWRVRITSDASLVHTWSTAHFGLWFDFGEKNPIFPYESSWEDNSKLFEADSGATYKSIMGVQPRMYKFRWYVTDSVRATLTSTVIPRLQNTIGWLYAPNSSFRAHLDGETIVPVWLTRAEARSPGPVTDYNIVELEFVEDVL